MPHIKQWFAAAICLFLLGCKTTPPPIPTSTLVPISSPTAEPTASVTKPPLATATLVPATATVIPATKVVAAATPIQPEEIALTGGTIPPTATPVPELLDRQPSLEAIQEYLSRTTIRYFSSNDGTMAESDYTYFNNGYGETPLTEYTERLYHDVNNDNENDLILSDVLNDNWSKNILVIMLWTDKGYTDPIALVGSGKYGLGQRIRFEDWTGDGLEELVYDYYAVYGGTGTTTMIQTQTVIQCQLTCEVVWWQETGAFSYFLGVAWKYTQIEKAVNEVEQPFVTVLTESFAIPIVIFWDEIPLPSWTTVEVYTTTLTTYTWNGTQFSLTTQTIVEPAQSSEIASNLAATHSSGVQATILTQSLTYPNFYSSCELSIIDNHPIIEPFDCLPTLTTISWQDLTHDGQDELVAITAVNGNQRILVFTWDGINASLIADIQGSIIRSDLFGVRIKDEDADGVMEIISGHANFRVISGCRPVVRTGLDEAGESCWREWVFSEQIYRWNGEMFILAEER